MRDFRDAESMAQVLRDGLKADGVELPDSRCLDLIAREFGYDDWSVMAAKIAAAKDPGGFAFGAVTPSIRIFDAAKAKEFYLGYLGFKTDWEHRFDDNAPLYTQISRAGLILHLSEHHGDGTPGSSFIVTMTGLEANHRELSAKGYGHWRAGLVESEWEGLTLQVVDPFNNRIRFREARET
jgi:catechol 2,3-dioxygenase-like lactoylglutathione lyase family enzyme